MRETTALQMTAPGVGAIAVVLVTGPRARAAVARIVAEGEKIERLQAGGMARVSVVRRGDGGTVAVDDAMALCSDPVRFELHLHGGVAVVDAVMELLEEAGARRVLPAEAAAFLGQGIGGEVAAAIGKTLTMTAARLVAAQGESGLAGWCVRWRRWLEGRNDGELWRLQSSVQWLLARSKQLRFLIDPARVAILGPPNAGKSTLANALLGRPISITSELAGTTRDWVDALATFHGGGVDLPVILVDTAGVRETTDLLERESIERSHQQARAADVVLLVLDGSRLPGEEEIGLLDRFMRGGESQRAIVVVSKVDAGKAGVAALCARAPGAVTVSGKQHQGLEQLMEAVLARLDLQALGAEEPFAFTARQQQVLAELALAPAVTHARALLDQLAHG